jgi:hypothetical protein
VGVGNGQPGSPVLNASAGDSTKERRFVALGNSWMEWYLDASELKEYVDVREGRLTSPSN